MRHLAPNFCFIITYNKLLKAFESLLYFCEFKKQLFCFWFIYLSSVASPVIQNIV